MATDPTFMPVDYTGTSPSNRIHNEQHILNRADPRDHRIVVPKFAPFYNNQGASDNKLKVVFHNPLTNTSKVLVEGIDYYCTHLFIDASKAIARPIYGSIEILDDSLEGIIKFEYYQALGGQWTITPEDLVALLASLKYNPRRTSWEQVVNPPERFPVVDHEWDLVDMVGMNKVVESLDKISDALFFSQGSTANDHIGDFNNPHRTTAAQVGAPSLQQFNYELATKLDINAASADSNLVYGLTLQELKDAIYATMPTDDSTFAGRTWTEAVVEILTGTAANSNRLEGLTVADLVSTVVNSVNQSTVNNADRFDGRTWTEAMAEILTGTAADSDRFAGMTILEHNQHVLDLIDTLTELNATVSNAKRLENHTLQQVLEEAKSQKVTDSERLDGRTYEQIMSGIKSGYITNEVRDGYIEPSETIYIELESANQRLTQLLVRPYVEGEEDGESGDPGDPDDPGDPGDPGDPPENPTPEEMLESIDPLHRYFDYHAVVTKTVTDIGIFLKNETDIKLAYQLTIQG